MAIKALEAQLFNTSEIPNSSDLISRQAAIDTVRKCSVKEVTPAFMLVDKAEVVTELMMLPSAQPELATDYTSKQSVIDAITDENIIRNMDSVMDSEMHRVKRSVHRIIASIPSAQPERKKGRWIPDNRPDGGFWVCSECKFPSEAFAANVLYKFCPNCGANMRG